MPSTEVLLAHLFAWVDIPAGTVTLAAGGYLNHDSTRSVAAFQISRYPITNAQFARFVEAGGYTTAQFWTTAGWQLRQAEGWTEPQFWQDANLNGTDQPVVGLSWFEAVAFCRWLSATGGEEVTLPSDAQWQRAAQGDDGRLYPWGNAWDASYCNNSVESIAGNTTPVQQHEGRGDSPFGVVDMAGNVWEHTLSGYDVESNDLDADAGSRVMRGGSWDFKTPDFFRCDMRGSGNPRLRNPDDGFRIVR